MQKNFPANKDQTILIKECDKYLWHVEQSRVDVHPKDPRKIRKTTWVKPYSKKDYLRIFEPEKAFVPAGPRKIYKTTPNLKGACLIAESRLVHDGDLQKKLDREAAEFVSKMSAGKAKEAVNAAVTEAQQIADTLREENERMKAQLASLQARVDDDSAQGEGSASGDIGDDMGAAKRPRRKNN
jgi:hypothetical protein